MRSKSLGDNPTLENTGKLMVTNIHIFQVITRIFQSWAVNCWPTKRMQHNLAARTFTEDDDAASHSNGAQWRLR